MARMRTSEGFIQVDGWEEFQRDLRRAKQTEYPKRIGQANKKTGQFVKDLVQRQASPSAVGVGRGASVRPSASKREVILRVGGAHRANYSLPKPDRSDNRFALASWGARMGRKPYERAPRRPYIKQIADDNRAEIGRFFLQAVSEALDTAFFETEP